ncbi:CLUMA_CG004873, isoform A [Clunio marinus]|uniref:CLUMA_CG004873, isoform A n=1 Tax=Clunio marinus TaxID=568069 RepID=A0A1J1HXE0_9DIPT|nr:CLUMA_CG004873, isoform A [Clunio marinus]
MELELTKSFGVCVRQQTFDTFQSGIATNLNLGCATILFCKRGLLKFSLILASSSKIKVLCLISCD